MGAVDPLRVVAPLLDRPPVVVLHLGDDERRRVDPPHALGELGEDVARRVVEDRVHRVEAEAVDAVVADPLLRVLERPLAHAVLRVVDRRAPEGVVAVGEVGAEGGDLLGAGAEVVVDDVEDHAEARRCAASTSRASPSGPP